MGPRGDYGPATIEGNTVQFFLKGYEMSTPATTTGGYASRARDARSNRGFRPAEGLYQGLFKNWEFKTSKSGNQMFVLEFKVLQGPTLEVTEQFAKSPKRVLRCQYVLSVPHHFDSFLILLEDLGVDLSTVRTIEQDPEYTDFRNIFDQVERRPPTCELKVKHQKDSDQNYNLDVKKIERIFTAPAPSSAAIAPALAAAPTAAPAPAAAPEPVPAPAAPTPAPAPAAAPAPVAAPVAPATPAEPLKVNGYTLDQYLQVGWTLETLAADPTLAVLIPKPAAAPSAAPAPVPAAAPVSAAAPAPNGDRPWY